MSNVDDKLALQEWEELLESVRNATAVELNETIEEKAERKRFLEARGNQEEWIAYHFPKYSFAKPAKFHKDSTINFLAIKKALHCRPWARGLAKSTRRMMEVFYMMFVKKIKINALLCSKSEDNAMMLLDPYRANLTANQRLIADYGTQEKLGKWKAEKFTTRSGHTFRAVGKGQNPRGAKNEELRINLVIFDDIDDDEECRNEDRLEATWKWCQESVIPTVEISRDYWICVDNNIIAEDSIALRFQALATITEPMNIRDESGRSSWPEKNSEEDIDAILALLSYESQQKEYYNNPMSQGKTFPDMKFGKCPPLHTMPYAIIYSDPATSNKDKPTVKSKLQNSFKAVWVIGSDGLNYYVYTGFLDTMSNSHFIDYLFAARDYVQPHTQPYVYIENNSLQDPFYEQVFLPLISQKQEAGKLDPLLVTPDTRIKGDKWIRIEGNLEPLNRLGNLILNIEEKENPHMKRLVAQFKAAKPTSRRLDGPDCIEGGYFIAREKHTARSASGGIITSKRKFNNKRA